VFADLCLPSPDEHLLKAKIAHAIGSTIRRRQLTQVEAGEIMQVDQAKVSHLLRGRLSGFSVERLMMCARALGRDVEIRISREHEGQGKIRVKELAA
jgi:predicted XRE-type DNA-binding protein